MTFCTVMERHYCLMTRDVHSEASATQPSQKYTDWYFPLSFLAENEKK